MLRKRERILLHVQRGQCFLPWKNSSTWFHNKDSLCKQDVLFPLWFRTSTLLEKPEVELSKTAFKGVSFYMWNVWHRPPLDGSKCCIGDEGLLLAHVRNQNDVMEVFLVDHAGQRPQWGWFRALHNDTHYFSDLSSVMKPKKRNYNCNPLGSFKECVEKDKWCFPWDWKASYCTWRYRKW